VGQILYHGGKFSRVVFKSSSGFLSWHMMLAYEHFVIRLISNGMCCWSFFLLFPSYLL